MSNVRSLNMATNSFVEIDLPEATDLADLTGIKVDLETARDFARMLKKEFESEKPNWTLVDPLSTAILVRYSRPFVTGVRSCLGEEAIQRLSGPQREKHARLRAFRDKHISHSVNAFEDNQPVARYWEERAKEEGITSIECNHSRITGLSSDDVEAVVELTTEMLVYVDTRLKEEKAKVLEIVRKIPLETVLSGAKGPWFPDMKSIDKRRPK
jgi:hypothetical protein